MVFEFDRSLAAFDGDAIVGTTAAYSFQLTVPGGVVGAGGVTFVSVLPSHRRRGILSAMMRHQLADIAARGEPVAVLFASESVIYGRYGYGCASGQLSLTIRRGEGALNPATAAKAGTGHGSVRLQAGQPAGLRAELAKVYDAAVPRPAGMMARDERWWHSVLADPEIFRRGMSPLKCLLAGDESGRAVMPCTGPSQTGTTMACRSAACRSASLLRPMARPRRRCGRPAHQGPDR